MPLWIPHQDAPSATADPFGYARTRDRVGDRVHICLALLWGVSIILGTFPAAFMTAVGAAYAILRIWATNPTYAILFRSWLFKLLFFLLLLNSLSLFWSVDQSQGLDELKIFRLHIPFLLAAWPILHKRGRLWLTAGICLSAVIAACAQVAQAGGLGPHDPDSAGRYLGFGWYDPGVPNRYPGFVHPSGTTVVQMVVGCFGIVWLSLGRSWRARIAGLVLCAACVVGLALAGSRASWIAAAVAWPVTILTCVVVPAAGGMRRRRTIGLALAVILIAVIGVCIAKRQAVTQRLVDARHEITAAWVDGDYRSDTGARIFQFRLSWELFLRRPLIGYGLGSYWKSATEIARSIPVAQTAEDEAANRESPPLENPRPVLEHPHSAVMHTAVTTGAVGLVMWLAYWVILFWKSCACTRMQRGESYSLALPAIVIGLAIAYVFDCQNISAPGTSILMFVTCLALRPTQE